MSAQFEPAGRGRRLAATAIDFVAVPTLALLIMLVTGVLEHADDFVGNQVLVRALLLGTSSYLLLNGWLLVKRGQTLGKAITGIKIIMHTPEGSSPLFRTLAARALFFPIAYLIFLPGPCLVPIIDQAFIFGKSRRTLHDRICQTSVVRV